MNEERGPQVTHEGRPLADPSEPIFDQGIVSGSVDAGLSVYLGVPVTA